MPLMIVMGVFMARSFGDLAFNVKPPRAIAVI